MNNFFKKFFKTFGAIVTAIAIFFSGSSVNIVSAAYSSPSTVSVNKPGWGIVAIDSGNLNVRQTASLNAQIVASLPANSSVMIVGQEGNFYKVQYNLAGNYGFVSKDYIEFRQEQYYLKVNNITGNVNMRFYASTDAAIVGKVPANTSFAYQYDVSTWYSSVYGNVVGAVSGEFVTKYVF